MEKKAFTVVLSSQGTQGEHCIHFYIAVLYLQKNGKSITEAEWAEDAWHLLMSVTKWEDEISLKNNNKLSYNKNVNANLVKTWGLKWRRWSQSKEVK